MSADTWHVVDERVTSEAARIRALNMARRLTRLRNSASSNEESATSNVVLQSACADIDESDLFVAMHTCSYHASRKQGEGKLSARDRRAWLARREVIRDYIVQQNVGLAYSMVGRFTSNVVDQDALLSDAMYSLVRAVDRFNPFKGYRFSTYACNSIARLLMRLCKKELKHRRRFPIQHEETHEQPVDLDDPRTELYVERLNRVLSENLGGLTQLETEVIAQRFPGDEQQPRQTFKEIADAVGLSKERVRQIQNTALRKLREVLDRDPLLNRG